MQNGSECARVAVQAIADELGISIHDNIIGVIAQEAEYRIQEYIKPAVILYKKKSAPKLTVQHVNMVIESIGVPPLLGYSSTLPYNTHTFTTEENDELCVVEDNKVNLEEAAMKISKPAPRPVPFYLKWMMVNGISIDRQNPSINKIKYSNSNLDTLHHHSLMDSIETQKLTNKDVITQDLQKYFERTIEIFNSNDEEQLKLVFYSLSRYSGIQPLLPLFIQFFSYQLMINLDDNVVLGNVCNYLNFLLKNESLPIYLFVHSILKILMTIVLKFNQGLNDAASDVSLRKACSEIIETLINRCISYYPNIRTVVSNAMLQTIFNPRSTLAAHCGALLCIQQLGKDVVLKLAPHIPFYVTCLQRELAMPRNNDEKKIQAQLIKNVLIQLDSILILIKRYEFTSQKYQATQNSIREIMNMIESVF